MSTRKQKWVLEGNRARLCCALLCAHFELLSRTGNNRGIYRHGWAGGEGKAETETGSAGGISRGLLRIIAACCELLRLIATYCGLLRIIAAYCGLFRLIANYCCLLRLIASYCGLLRIIAAYCDLLRLIEAEGRRQFIPRSLAPPSCLLPQS